MLNRKQKSPLSSNLPKKLGLSEKTKRYPEWLIWRIFLDSRPISRTHSIYAQFTAFALTFALKELQTKTNSYFFLKPAGHFGLTAVTFLISFPLTQMIVVFFREAAFRVERILLAKIRAKS